MTDNTPHTPAQPGSLLERLRQAAELLDAVSADKPAFEALPKVDQKRLKAAVSRFHNPDPIDHRKERRARKREHMAKKNSADDAVLNATGIRELRRKPVFTTPNYFPPSQLPMDSFTDEPARESIEPQHCYVCKQKYTLIHHFYDQMCPACADFNFIKRTETADLRGRVALLTGGRVKIGYQAGLKLLRAGARLIVTTRFPRDSAARYAEEPDFGQWGHNLEVFGLDLRHTPSVEAFCQQLLATHDRLDFIINNACQTVRRPPEFYAHMMAGETAAHGDMPEHVRKLLGRYEGVRAGDILPAGPA
nr:SDR family oxidoreductase [Arenimonas sp.]